MLKKTETAARPLRIGVDSGGTFTDVCMVDEATGRVQVWKVSSTPHDPSEGIANGIGQGIAEFAQASGTPVEVVYFGHGTTVATNALIQGRGAETGLLTTAGFRDLLELRRQRRPSLYDIQTVKPPLLVSRNRRLEVTERTLFDGSVAVPLDEDGVRDAVRKLRDQGVQSIAICLLFSFIAPEHEQRVKAIVAEEFPEAFLSVSHEVAPEFREYERLSTTVVNARLGPLMKSYLERLSPRLEAIGVGVQPHLTQSNGGVMSCESAQQQPVRLVLSGPAAGIMGAVKTGEAAGVENLITFDMGGTSSDVSLIDRGKPQMVNDVEVHGYPLKAPMIDIHTVGAGGGSVAYVDVGGLLKVGPRSAGADPGPACYGRGATEPTVTDANVLMQVLNPTHLLGGRMPIDRALSEAAIAGLADKLGLGLMETAHGIIRIVTANMAKAIRVISVERGYDPRDYTMMAFGGAGPLHAARLARELEMPRVMIPKYPGILCAMGLLVADLRSNFAITRMTRLEPAAAQGIETAFHGLEARAEAWFEQEGIAPVHRRVTRALDMRYGGQGYELTVAAPEGPITGEMLPELRRRFEQIHRQIYGYAAAEESVQVTTLRLEALGEVRKVELPRADRATGPASAAITGSRKVYFGEVGDFVECPLYDREKLQPGHSFSGPALVDQMDSTSLVLPGQTATVDAHLNLFIEG